MRLAGVRREPVAEHGQRAAVRQPGRRRKIAPSSPPVTCVDVVVSRRPGRRCRVLARSGSGRRLPRRRSRAPSGDQAGVEIVGFAIRQARRARRSPRRRARAAFAGGRRSRAVVQVAEAVDVVVVGSAALGGLSAGRAARDHPVRSRRRGRRPGDQPRPSGDHSKPSTPRGQVGQPPRLAAVERQEVDLRPGPRGSRASPGAVVLVDPGGGRRGRRGSARRARTGRCGRASRRGSAGVARRPRRRWGQATRSSDSCPAAARRAWTVKTTALPSGASRGSVGIRKR